MGGIQWFLLLTGLLPALLAPVQAVRVRLLDEAITQRNTIWLSDFLPADAAAGLRAAAEKICLGRSPQPGSVRVFTAEQVSRAAMKVMGIEIPARVVVRRPGWTLNATGVRRALTSWEAARGLDFSQANLLLPEDFRTRSDDPGLDVVSVGRSSERGFSATLRCRERAVCGSFLAEVLIEHPSEVDTYHRTTAKPRFLSARPESRQLAVQPGKPASLIIEDQGLRISMRVLPLKRAGPGEVVRVLDPVGHRVFLADVAPDGQLRVHDNGTGNSHERAK